MVELAELAAEAHQIVVGKALAAEAQDQMLGPAILDLGDELRGQRPGEIDPLDIRAPMPPRSAAPRPAGRSITAAICRASAISTVAIRVPRRGPGRKPRTQTPEARQPMGGRQEASTNASRVTMTSPAAVRRTRLTVPT